ncbi:MAG: BMP family ABC transporter substrate-binding protein, partial [Spirochaetales bacterium]|nr:BMP family ABC transporter substrate-binding protein [Spirochaetales bacterium]
MKKALVILASLLLISTAVFANGQQEASSSDDGTMSVALLINGNLGDKSFHDSANHGMQMIKDELGCETKVVEVGYDSSKWEPALLDLCDEGHDIIICGTWQMQSIVAEIAPEYPEQKFIVYDTSMDYSDGGYSNVYSIEYLQNDGSFLAGVLAAGMSKSGVIGFVGGMDNTVILDFLVGYINGAKTVNSDIKVVPSFVGNFSDSAKAKELTFAQYQMGADVVFSCASNAGEGTMQASAEKGQMAIGVDSDQAMLYKESNPELANLIISSVLKRVDQSIFLAVQQAIDGSLPWGTRVGLGINESCVGLADNEFYQANVPAEVRDEVANYESKIKNGEIT